MFGNGTRTSHAQTAQAFATGRRVTSVFDNAMTAHVWAALTQSFGRSGNGNLYFEGRALFSYGTHWTAGFILPATVRDMGPGVFPAFELEGRGGFLVSCSSRSVSTNRHQSEARHAARDVPGAPLFLVSESVVAKARELFELRGFTLAELGAKAVRFLGELAPEDMPSEEAAAAFLRAFGLKAPERAAAKAAKASASKAAREAADRAKAKTARELAQAKRAAENWTPDTLRARMAEEAKEDGRSRWASSHKADRWADQGRELFRAYKAAKAAGRTAQARKVKALHAAVREGLGLFPAAQLRSARRMQWADAEASIRLAIAQAKGESMPYGRGRVAPGRMESASYVLTQGAEAARRLSVALVTPAAPGEADPMESPWAAVRARVMGLEPLALATRLGLLSSELFAFADRENRAASAQARKRKVNGLQAARDLVARTVTHQVNPAELAKALRDAESILGSYAPSMIGGRPFPPVNRLPGAARVAGWTPERIGEELARVRTARALADVTAREAAALAARDKAEREARERAEAERLRAPREAQALALWRAGASSYDARAQAGEPPPRGDALGGAYLRAVDVKRSDAGEVTGGTLQTSQGAEVPLTHALRVFAFLKAVRAKGEGWHANGRTLRVGPFTVDSIAPDGSFRAGCHAFAWAEIAQLAEGLGVFELAPEDTTQESGTRH